MASTVRAAAHIPMPIDRAWERMRDLTLATDYVPGLTNTVITTEQKEGVGASRRVVSRQAGPMDETVAAEILDDLEPLLTPWLVIDPNNQIGDASAIASHFQSKEDWFVNRKGIVLDQIAND